MYWWQPLLLFTWLGLIFVFGTVVGSFLNVCICRLPYEKSLLWPLSSHCGKCLRRIDWQDNLPLVSYLWLRGRCRHCRAPFSMRYFWVELLTGLGFVGLFYVEVVLNVHNLPALRPRWGASILQTGMIPVEGWALFLYHAALLSFLIVASAIDLEHFEIPMPIPVTGLIVGLVGGALLWPLMPAQASAIPLRTSPAVISGPTSLDWLDKRVTVQGGLYPWPVWDSLPDWLPADSPLTGLVTGLAGMLAGTFVLRAVRSVFGIGRGIEGMGLGDADLMMMAGAFLGWQPTVAAFFVSVAPALLFGLFQIVFRRTQELPFGPSLAVGCVTTLLCWKW
ncbi:MAG TPA: prepilin peptidase, partial [Gemmataceae bacterium]|nr:prepilin peptidase [Gemmataceae bacterium]